MEISGKGLLYFYQQTSSLIGNQTNHRTNMCLPYSPNSRYESIYECICIVINGKKQSVPLNILKNVYMWVVLRYTFIILCSVISPDQDCKKKSVFCCQPYCHLSSCIKPLMFWNCKTNNRHLLHASNKCTDQPEHPSSLISAFVI